MDGFVDGSSEQAMVADRAGAALFGTFVGDALGMPFEGLPRELIPRHVEMVEARLGRGTYTDDTQMMVALAESLIARGRVDVEHLSRAFLDAYDVERGYGGGTRRVLELWRAGVAVDVAAAQVFDGQGRAAMEQRCGLLRWLFVSAMTTSVCASRRRPAHASPTPIRSGLTARSCKPQQSRGPAERGHPSRGTRHSTDCGAAPDA